MHWKICTFQMRQLSYFVKPNVTSWSASFSWLFGYIYVFGLRTTLWRSTGFSTYLLTYSMVRSHSWEANWFAVSQEIQRISRNPKIHYRTHKCPPSVSILGQPNPVHIPTSHLLEIHPIIIQPSMPRSPQWSPSLRFPHQDPLHTSSPPQYAPHSQPISFFSILSPAQASILRTTLILHARDVWYSC